MENLKELKRKYEELGKEIERLEKKKTGRWRAEYDVGYYYFNDYGAIIRTVDEEYNSDNIRYKTRNYFKTEEEAQEYFEKINIYYELMDLAEELNNGEEIDWEDSTYKNYLYYDFSENKLGYNYTWHIKKIGQIYCLDKNFLEIAKERIGEERLIKLFK